LFCPDSKKAHPPVEKWWNVFKSIFELDPNSLVHGVLFPQWQIKIPRALTAHLEAFGAGRVDRSGVKFDRLGKTTSGQPIFAVDDATAESIRATFVLDVSLIRSFGRTKKEGDKQTQLGLSEKQQEFLIALALWKIQRLLASPFRFRSGCHLRCTTLESCYEQEVEHRRRHPSKLSTMLALTVSCPSPTSSGRVRSCIAKVLLQRMQPAPLRRP
jgi:CRISPR-associated protein Csb1